MESGSLHQFIQYRNHNGKPMFQATQQASEQFSNVLKSVVFTNPMAVQASHHTHEQALKKEKEKKYEEALLDDGEDESLLKTVKNIEKRLVALARLERQMMAGF